MRLLYKIFIINFHETETNNYFSTTHRVVGILTESIFKRFGSHSNLMLIFIAFIAYASFFYINSINPPFSSPDENYHFLRAESLSRGELLLESHPGKRSGSTTDKNYVEFMSLFKMLNFNKEATPIGPALDKAKSLNWSKESEYYEAPNVAIYFPAIYAPQALAIALGKSTGLSIYNTYYLARVFNFTASLIIIFCAWRIYKIPSLALAMLVMPMTAFQLLSTAIDGTIISLTVLAMCIIFRLHADSGWSRSKPLSIALYLSIFLIGTSKVNLAAILLVPFVFSIVERKYKHTALSIITAIPIIVWTLIVALHGKNDFSDRGGMPLTDILSHYLRAPYEMASIIFGTMTDPFFLNSFAHQFVGVLGWLDINLPESIFYLVSLALIIVLLISLAKFKPSKHKALYASIIASSAISIVLIFFALLIQFSPFPTTRVIGIQGRYFIMPLIIMAYVFADNKRGKLEFLLTSSIFVISTLIIRSEIVSHYY